MGTGAGPPLLQGFWVPAIWMCLSPTEPGTTHTLPPTIVCCSFNRIDFICFNIHISVFKYISYLTVGICQTGAAHRTQIWSHFPAQGPPHHLTHTYTGEPSTHTAGTHWVRNIMAKGLRGRHRAPTPVLCFISACKNIEQAAGTLGSPA